jgi:hypothetical protein
MNEVRVRIRVVVDLDRVLLLKAEPVSTLGLGNETLFWLALELLMMKLVLKFLCIRMIMVVVVVGKDPQQE